MNRKSYQPLSDFIVVRKPGVTEGGIIVPDNAGGPRDGVTVVAVGPGRITEHGALIEPRVKVGDRVMIMDTARIAVIPGSSQSIAGEKGGDLALVRETEVACIVLNGGT